MQTLGSVRSAPAVTLCAKAPDEAVPAMTPATTAEEKQSIRKTPARGDRRLLISDSVIVSIGELRKKSESDAFYNPSVPFSSPYSLKTFEVYQYKAIACRFVMQIVHKI